MKDLILGGLNSGNSQERKILNSEEKIFNSLQFFQESKTFFFYFFLRVL